MERDRFDSDAIRKDLSEEELPGWRRRRRPRKTIGEEGTRKQIAIGLFLTILLSLFFYLPTEIKRWWERFNQPKVITVERPMGDEKDVAEIVGFEVEIKRREDVVGAVEQLLEGQVGDYGIYVERMESDEGFGIKENQVFTAASIIKLPILVAYYQAVDRGELDPETVYVLQEKDRFEYGTGSLQNQAAGTEYSYREIAHLVANQSDNMGAELLLKFLGGTAKVELSFKAWGLTQTSVKENETTAKETVTLFKKLYRGELLSDSSKTELFNNLTNTVMEERLPAGVPTGIKVVHKFGSEAGVINDCGIVYSQKPYGVCVLSDKVNEGEAEGVLPKISRVVWEWAGRT
jgi:beta-lactamase class A